MRRIKLNTWKTKALKHNEILEPIKESKAHGNANNFVQIIGRATKTLNRFLREWMRLRDDERPDVKSEMFKSMLDYCRAKIKSRDDRER